jgi:hypothetical protein
VVASFAQKETIMPASRKHHRDEKGLLKRRSTRPKAQHDGQLASHSRQNALVQLTRQGASIHSANDILQLQRLVGNRAVTRQLGRATAGASMVVQRAKGVEERGVKHQRIAKAKEAIPTLSGKLKDELVDHVFDAKPFGKNVKLEDPQGLHAYKSGGNLPGDIEEVSTKGSKGQVHLLTWKYKKGNKSKSSTMFPDWMPPDHVKTLIALKFPQDGKVVKDKIDLVKLGISPEGVKTYISHGQDINIDKSGDTVYPTK